MHFNSILAFLVILLCCVSLPVSSQELSLTPKEQQWLKQHPVIRYGMDPNYAPIEYIDKGEHLGISNEYLRLIGKRLGVRFQLADITSWTESLSMARSRELDLLTVVQATEQRRAFLGFTNHYLELDTAIITRDTDLISKELTIQDMNGKNVAVVKDYFWSDFLPVDYPQINIIEVENLVAGFQAVAFGKADSMFATYATATHYIQESHITNLKVSGVTPYKLEYGMAIRSDWPELVELINKALLSITDEEKAAIRARWIALNYHVPWYNKKIVLTAIAAAILFVLMVFVWSYTLREQVKRKTLELAQMNNDLESLVEKRTAELELSNKNLKTLSELDSLTQVYNRHFLDDRLTKLFSNRAYHGENIAVFMIDVDCFKQYNDFYGHTNGDKCLYEIAQAINSLVRREGDIFARYGGEEFTLVHPLVDPERAKLMAQRVHDCVQELGIPNQALGENKSITISIGYIVVELESGMNPEQVIEKADKALYQAKAEGRNRSKVYMNDSGFDS